MANVYRCVFALLWFFRAELFTGKRASDTQTGKKTSESTEKQTVLEISVQARKNLGLVVKAAKPQEYWQSVLIPIELTISDPVMQVTLKAAPQATDPAGKASRFVGNHEKLGVVQEYAGTISGVIDGTPYSGEFKEEPHGAH